MRRVADIVRTFRNQLQAFGAYLLEENWRLRRSLYLFEKIWCIITCQGEIISETILVGTTVVRLRRHDSMAKKTTVSNIGPNAAIVYENDVVVGLVQPNKTLFIPLQGRLSISAKTATGTATLTITTLRRCECGDQPYTEGDYQPIGGNLI